MDELIVRELVAKVVLPVVEAGWPTGGQGVANQVSFEFLFPPPPPTLLISVAGETAEGGVLMDVLFFLLFFTAARDSAKGCGAAGVEETAGGEPGLVA